MRFEVVTTSAGALSIRSCELNEIMHNPVGPWVEANSLYIEQSHLAERLAQFTAEPLVLFDVGLGAAANSIAALHCARSVPGSRIKIVSFERDLELGHFALANAAQFPHFKGWEAALEQLLTTRHWQGEGIEWVLREGDFLEQIERESETADLVFYDPYSAKVNREMWTADCFARLRRRCSTDPVRGTSLYTYSQATPVRSALLKAGFFVGQGSATGLKEETTQATTNLKDLSKPLAQPWFRRWTASHAKYPFLMLETEQAAFETFMRQHPQFLT